MNDTVKVARAQASAEKTKAITSMITELAKNPVIEIIAAYVIIESLQSRKIIPELAGTLAEGGCLTAVGLQQLAPMIPYLASSNTDSLTKLAPLAAFIK